MANFYSVPPEIIEQIILDLDPLDVARIAQCSSLFRSLVYSPTSQALWRTLYLDQPLDDPRICVSQQGKPRTNIDWKGELQRLIRARTVLHDTSLCRPGERLAILKTIVDMVSYVPPLSDPEMYDDVSQNLLWGAALLRGGKFLEEVGPSADPAERQLCARLHTYFGVTHADAKPPARVQSRACVYDMRNYRWDNEFGPFDSQDCVDWVHLQALHHVVSMHVVDLSEDEDFVFAIFPMSLPFTQIVMPGGVNPDEVEDWAGVGGLWRVSFCFCDHRDLIKYNQSSIADGAALDPSIFEQPSFGEVFRTLDVSLRVMRTHTDPNHPRRPIIFFAGEMAGTTSTITGQVKMTRDDQVQWHFVSGDHGNAIWSSQGVHVGGLQSSFGVLGAWTTIFHDDDDPVGPFWLRRRTVSSDTVMPH
ncbi:hypothetical protein BDZ94DRAFT_1254290 [Collybia nuda]|uniref:F-box domain-containing protein n=1 Tax=Collybia nuda TaxID=64659 RepID=A0A9P6CKG5_9AGAR|nr:hypothetical protein BDZ94DRAFT_1254290 [Collybia nuda]